MNWKEGFGGLQFQHPDISVVLQPFWIIRISNFFFISLQLDALGDWHCDQKRPH